MVNKQGVYEGTFFEGKLVNGKASIKTNDKEFWAFYVKGQRNGNGWEKMISNGNFKLGVFEDGNFVRGIIYESYKSKTDTSTVSYFGSYKDRSELDMVKRKIRKSPVLVNLKMGS